MSSPRNQHHDETPSSTLNINGNPTVVNDTQESRMPSPTPASAQNTQTSSPPTHQPSPPPQTSPTRLEHSPTPTTNHDEDDHAVDEPAAHEVKQSSEPESTNSGQLEHRIQQASPLSPPQSNVHIHDQDRDPNVPLEAYNWDDLESRFEAKMKECGKVEEGIETEFRMWLEVCAILSFLPKSLALQHSTGRTPLLTQGMQFFKDWSTTASAFEEERGGKRYAHFLRSSFPSLPLSRINNPHR